MFIPILLWPVKYSHNVTSFMFLVELLPHLPWCRRHLQFIYYKRIFLKLKL